MKHGPNNLTPDKKPKRNIQFLATEKQWSYVKARSLMDGIDMQDVLRSLIEKAYDNELRNGVDVVKLAKDNWLL